MLGIIGAMEVEVATLKSAINNLKVTKKAGMNSAWVTFLEKRCSCKKRYWKSKCSNLHTDISG